MKFSIGTRRILLVVGALAVATMAVALLSERPWIRSLTNGPPDLQQIHGRHISDARAAAEALQSEAKSLSVQGVEIVSAGVDNGCNPTGEYQVVINCTYTYYRFF